MNAALTIGLLFGGALALADVRADLQKLDLSPRALAAAAATYVADYQAKFKFLVAEETYTQATFDAQHRQTRTRRMTGELFLAFIPADAVWIAVHDVAVVDGTPVADREDLRLLLRQGEFSSVAKRVADRNEQFNIGGVRRNFNEPTLPLLVLDPRRLRRVSFDRKAIEQDAGTTQVRLAFAERERPTLVRSARGMPLFSKGELTIDAKTGRVERTAIELVDAGIRARLTTVYALEAKLDMWVPVTFAERYEVTRGRKREVIECEARYTNYRRFEVTGRIK